MKILLLAIAAFPAICIGQIDAKIPRIEKDTLITTSGFKIVEKEKIKLEPDQTLPAILNLFELIQHRLFNGVQLMEIEMQQTMPIRLIEALPDLNIKSFVWKREGIKNTDMFTMLL